MVSGSIAATAQPWADNDVYEPLFGDFVKQGSEHCVENLAWVIAREPNLIPRSLVRRDCRHSQRFQALSQGFTRIRQQSGGSLHPRSVEKVRTDSVEASGELRCIIWKLTTADVSIVLQEIAKHSLQTTFSRAPKLRLSAPLVLRPRRRRRYR